jgi:N-acetylglucosamine kinase-like BadF-type ATPase
MAATRSPDFDALIRWAASASPAEVAAIAPHVLEVAEEGDTLARGIADYAARELSQLAICLLPKMEVDGRIGVAITGGLLSANGLLRRSVLAVLGGEAVLEPMETPVDAVVGALHLAAKEP